MNVDYDSHVLPTTCPSPKCPMCQHVRCCACAQPDGKPLPGCTHDRLERHTEPPPPDTEVVEDPDSSPGIALPTCRVVTRPTAPILMAAVDIDLEDGEGLASFLEVVARITRSKKRIRILVEGID